MRRSTILVGGLVWLVVVAGASLVTWQVIDAAGRGVLSEQTEAGGPAATGTGTPSATPGRGGGTGGNGGGRTRTPSPSASADDSPVVGATTEVRTWRGTAGTVIARCTGTRASVQSAYPTVGWGVEVKKGGPLEIEVEFRRDDPDGRVRVEGRCVGGIPQLAVETDDAGGDDGGDDGGSGDDDSGGSSGGGSGGGSGPG